MSKKYAWIGGGLGFIGHHMARRLKKAGYWVRVVDIEPYRYGEIDFADEVVMADLRDYQNVKATLRLSKNLTYSYHPHPFEETIQFDEVYSFQCLMGGAGFVFTGLNDADIMHDSALMNLNVCEALKEQKFTGKIFYSSSACVYPEFLQNDYQQSGLRESDAIPAAPDSCYGWEKLFSERLYLAYQRNYGLDVRIARFHNIYGPEGTYKGGKEKAPAAMCRKVVEQHNLDEAYLDDRSVDRQIEIWGTGHQTRSFLYIDDCLDAVRLLMESDFKEPINIGSEEMVTINQLAEMAIGFSGKQISIKHISGPTGVMGRNSCNDLIREKLNWEPKYSLKEGLKLTYDWISKEMAK